MPSLDVTLENALNPYGTSQFLTGLPDTHPKIQIAGDINVGPTVENCLNILAVSEDEDGQWHAAR